MKKHVLIDENAFKELHGFTQEVQTRFAALFTILEREGRLTEPYAKRINAYIFEIRVKSRGQWRALYAYIHKNDIVILTAFNKKSQKTPKIELDKAMKRLKRYI